MAYDYYKEVTDDVIEYLRENRYMMDDDEDINDVAEEIYDDLIENSDITGNMSGSYTFDSFKAKGYVLDNFDLFKAACDDFGYGYADVGEWFLDELWETMDVIIREFVLRECVENAINEYL